MKHAVLEQCLHRELEGSDVERMTPARRAQPHGGERSAGMALLRRGIRDVAHLADYTRYGGAPLLGFEQIFIKAHGRSSAPAIENAVKVAAKAVRDGVAQAIAQGIEAVK